MPCLLTDKQIRNCHSQELFNCPTALTHDVQKLIKKGWEWHISREKKTKLEVKQSTYL